MEEFSAESLNCLIKSRESNNIDAKTFISQLIEFEKKLSTEPERFQICYALGIIYCHDGSTQDLNLAEKYLLKSLNDFPSHEIRDELWKIYFNLGHLYARKCQSDKSKEYFEKYILHSNDHGILNLRDCPLYSFRKINKYTISDIVNSEMTLSDPKIFNDPYDTLLYSFLNYRNKEIINKSNYSIDSLIDAYKPIRIRCFAANKLSKDPIKNRLMWSHYADEHKGICIQYHFTISPYSVLEQYGKKDMITKWIEMKYINDLNFGDEGKMSSQLLFATKHHDWSYENEVRLLHYDPKYSEKQQHIQIPLEKLGGKIKAIIFGSRCSEKDEQTIRGLFKNKDIFFKILGSDYLEKNDNVYDLRIDNEEKWKDQLPK